MNSTEALALLRRDLVDVAEPYLWSDPELYTWIDDAQRRFCIETDGIRDMTTPEVTRYAVTAGSEWISTHASIVRPFSAHDALTGRPIEITDQAKADERNLFFDGRTGDLQALIIGLEDNKLRACPPPRTAMTIVLHVGRLPLNDVDGEGKAFEIREEHILHILSWAKRMAYLKEDPDTFNKSRAEEHEARFLAYCAKAKNEARRRRFKSGTVSYGGL